MTAASVKTARKMPKGGRKGGSVFPRVSLADALGYARKLVSKTHTGAQPQDVIHSGVVGAKAGTGNVRISSLKQYGFIKGDTKSNYSASELAKQISAAPAEEVQRLYRQAVLKPTVFRKIFDAYHGDTVSKAKLKQRAADLNVHPDETGACVELYLSGMTTAGLVTVNGEQITHVASSEAFATPVAPSRVKRKSVSEGEESESGEQAEADKDGEHSDVGDDVKGTEAANNAQASTGMAQTAPRAVFNVNVTLDSSLDIEKLQKQLELLKRFGAI